MWRVGDNYGIHVYEGPKPGSRAVATFHHPDDAKHCVYAVNCVAELEAKVARLKDHAEAMAEALGRVRDECEMNLSCNHPGDDGECEDIDDCVRCFLDALAKETIDAYRRDYPGGESQCQSKR